MKKIDFLRKKYPRFVYERYSYKISNNNLEIFFYFSIEPDIKFQPKIVIEKIGLPAVALAKAGDRVLNNFVFHLGLMEMPSYWKATCSPKIIIKAGYLNEEQINWWQDLFIQGMGQFFYENKIDWRNPNFLKLDCAEDCGESDSTQQSRRSNLLTSEFKNRYLVPIGGGKDSIVTLEKLKERKKRIGCFSVNPTKAAKDVVRISGIKDLIIVRRKIDPALLELNKKGFLNGHTPITAVLSFLSVFCAVLFGYQRIAFSNEKSANEGNVRYLGKTINHQYSKSSEFERRFKFYIKKYLTSQVEYFRFLRKYTELEIAGMFTKYPKYFSVFSSCNVVVAKKLKQRWCGSCPKCLFVYMTLYSFLKEKELLEIFGKDIFDPLTSSEQENLLSIMKGLLGKGKHKPFECVGTKKESRLALKLSLKKVLRQAQGKPLPYLLQKFNGPR